VFKVPLRDILIDAADKFHTAQQIADFLEVSQPTLYSWIKRHIGLSFRQFKRKFICSHRTCIVIDHGTTDYSWKYTLADRIHQQQGCVCFIEGSASLMMTTLTSEDVGDMLKASVSVDVTTGIRHIRYPVRLPIFKGPDNEADWVDPDRKRLVKCNVCGTLIKDDGVPTCSPCLKGTE